MDAKGRTLEEDDDVTDVNPASLSSSSSSTRGDARVAMAAKWASRRKQQQEEQQRRQKELSAEEHHQTQANNNNNNNKNKPINRPMPQQQRPSKTAAASNLPPFCVLIRRSWIETLNGLKQIQQQQQQQQQQLPKSSQMASTGQQQQQPASLKQQQAERRRTTFPSVLSILQANALKLQVASMMEEEEEEQETEEQQEEREQQQKVLSILPSDFDFISTVNHMSESRSRAFLLLDFSAIVQTHTVWRKRLPKMKKNVQMVYSTRYNANIKLLQLFARLGVGLRVSTKYDLQRVKESCSYNDENDGSISSSVLWDDFSLLAKPTSFYRSLILDTHTRSDTTDETIPFAVDGIDEFDRIRAHLTSIANRRKQRLPCLNVVLKLDGIHHQDWKNVLTALSDQSSEFGHKVVGFAMELIDENKHGDSEAISSALEKLSDLIEFCHTSGILSLPQVHLTNPSTSSDIDISVIQWMENHAKLCRQITIDVSRLLVAHSAALCARIIGVKQNDASRIHYYIDDGCYGSLSNYSNKGIPLPLKSKKALGSSNISIEKDQQGILATVWGPTCDGLDKVCSDIVLPRLHRDDWLVFTDLGFCHEGTCFNGFSPPDIACCVIGGYL